MIFFHHSSNIILFIDTTKLSDPATIGTLLQGIFAALGFPVLIFTAWIGWLTYKSQKKALPNNPNFLMSSQELKALDTVVQVLITVFNKLPDFPFIRNFKGKLLAKSKSLKERSKVLERRLMLSSQASIWLLENERIKKISYIAGKAIIDKSLGLKYRDQPVHYQEDVKEVYFEEIGDYLRIISRCLSTFRSNPIDKFIQEYEPTLDIYAYVEALKWIKDQAHLEDLSKDAFEEMKRYIQYLIIKLSR